MPSTADFLQVILPLVGLLVVLITGRRLAADIRPIFVNVIGGVAKNAQSNAMVYAIAILFGLTASCSAFIDVFKDLDAKAISAMSWHQYAVCWVKVLNPFGVTIIAYFTKAPLNPAGAPAAQTSVPHTP